MGAWRKATQEPVRDRGRLMMNHMHTSTSMVVKGTAPLAPRAQTKRLSRKKTAKTEPGMTTGVRMKFCFHFSPWKNLYVRAET